MQTAPLSRHSGVHLQLRTATRGLHDAVERVVGLPESVTTPEAYRAVLERFWGFHQPLEEALGGLDWGGFDFDARRRAASAARDLEALGASAAHVAALPRHGVTRPGSIEEAWGRLYVLEGSTLGGRVIRRALQPRLGPTLEGATAFLDGRDGEGGPMWRSFLLALDAQVRTPEQRTQAQAGAEATFREMIAWFS